MVFVLDKWKRYQEFFEVAGYRPPQPIDSGIRYPPGTLVYEKPTEQVEFEKWVRKVSDRTGNFRVNKEDGLDRPLKIVDSIIRIRKEHDKSEGYVISKQTWIGLDVNLNEIPHAIESMECYHKPVFVYRHRPARGDEESERLPTGTKTPEIVFTKPYIPDGKEYMDELMKIASPGVVFSASQMGPTGRSFEVNSYEDLRNKKFDELVNPRYSSESQTTLKKKITPEIVA